MYKVDKNSDLYIECEGLCKGLLKWMDPGVSLKVSKRGITVLQNVYAGYDTEYKNVDFKTNKLLSVQLAINTMTQLKIPLNSEYVISDYHTEKGKLYPKERVGLEGSGFNINMYESSMNEIIKMVRGMKYRKIDSSVELICRGLIDQKVPHTVCGDWVVFSFPRTPIQTFIYYEGEGTGYSLKEMMCDISKIAKPYLEIEHAKMLKLMTEIYERREELGVVGEFSKEWLRDLESEMVVTSEENNDFIVLDNVVVKNRVVKGGKVVDEYSESKINLDEKLETACIEGVEKVGKPVFKAEDPDLEGSEDFDSNRYDVEKTPVVEKSEEILKGTEELLDEITEADVSELEKEKEDEEALSELPDAVEESELESSKPVEGEGIKDRYKKDLAPIKRCRRTFISTFSGDAISVTHRVKVNLISHSSAADLCMLNDIQEYFGELSIVHKNFVTLRKPINTLMEGFDVKIDLVVRDTLLLAPGQKRSLSAIGSLYGARYEKVQLSADQISNMDKLILEDKVLFERYAVLDSIIPLIHASRMEEMNLRMCKSLGIPITVSGFSRKYIEGFWDKVGYRGYQISPNYLIGDASVLQTPKGLNAASMVGECMSCYISAYKGGRNESFMYGLDKKMHIYDYDLNSAYTTVLSMAGDPDYNNVKRLTKAELDLMGYQEILYSYTVVKVNYDFSGDVLRDQVLRETLKGEVGKKGEALTEKEINKVTKLVDKSLGGLDIPKGSRIIKYPNIGVNVDETTTAYTLKGEGVWITGSEYLTALRMRCRVEVLDCVSIPFKSMGVKRSISLYQDYLDGLVEEQDLKLYLTWLYRSRLCLKVYEMNKNVINDTSLKNSSD